MEQVVMYHGTDNDFNSFSNDFLGENTQENNTKIGFYFIQDISMAQLFGANVLECVLKLNKGLDINDVFKGGQQASDICKIIFLEDLEPNEAKEFIDENISLGEIEDFMESFQDPEVIEQFKALGYDHLISRFSDDRIQVCVFNPENIKIVYKDVISRYSGEEVKVIALDQLHLEAVQKALNEKDFNLRTRQLNFIATVIKKNLNSIPNKIDGEEVTILKKTKILAGFDHDSGRLTYSIKDSKLIRAIDSLPNKVSTVYNFAVEEENKLKKGITNSVNI